MKQKHYDFKPDDLPAVIFSLSTFAQLNREDNEIQQDINRKLCLSATEKLVHRQTNLTPNEIRVIAVSIFSMQDIISGYIDVDDSVKKELQKYLFTINKLADVFEPILHI